MKRKRSVDKLMPRYDDMEKYKYTILNMARIFNEFEHESARWDISTFNKIKDSLPNINVALQEKLDNISDERIFFGYLKNSVNNAAIKYFSTGKRCDTTVEYYDYIWGYFNKEKLNDQNIKAFSDEVNNVIESYDIVLAALKLRNILIPETIEQIIEYLCPKLSEMGYEYLKEKNEYLVQKLDTLLNNKRTFWSKLGNGFTISNQSLKYILKKITNPHESEEDDGAKLYSSSPVLDYKEKITKPCDNKENNAMSRFNKLYHSFFKHQNSKEDTTNSFNPRESKKLPLNKHAISLPVINSANSIITTGVKIKCDNDHLFGWLAPKALDPSEEGLGVLGEHLEAGF